MITNHQKWRNRLLRATEEVLRILASRGLRTPPIILDISKFDLVTRIILISLSFTYAVNLKVSARIALVSVDLILLLAISFFKILKEAEEKKIDLLKARREIASIIVDEILPFIVRNISSREVIIPKRILPFSIGTLASELARRMELVDELSEMIVKLMSDLAKRTTNVQDGERSSTPNIRPATLNDVGEIMDIERDSFPDPWSEDAIISSLERTLVAESDGEVIGYIIASRVCDEVSIENIAVRKDKRGRGTGSLLLDFVIKGNPDCNFFLEVRKSNVRALNFYKKFNFTEYYIRKNYYGDEDAIVMVRWKERKTPPCSV